jgi:hypothetical protein
VALEHGILGGRVTVSGEQFLRHRVDRVTDVAAQLPRRPHN